MPQSPAHPRTGRPRRSRPISLLAVLVVGGALLAGPVGSASAAPKNNDGAVVASWNQIATSTIAAAKSPAESFLYMGFVQAAVYDAVVGITGGYQPYQFTATAPRSASTQAAVAAAAHRVLVTYFPSAAGTLETALTTSLAAVPDGPAKDKGVAFGELAADRIIELRQNDGRDAPIQFTQPPAPGVWRPTPPAFAPMVAPYLAFVRPLFLSSPTQFMPGPPPALTSDLYTADLAEVRADGSATSVTRTTDQTATALFFSGNAFPQYEAGLRDQIATRGLDVLQASRLLAAVSMSQADTVISVWRAKWTYGFWRPQTAIQLADTDGNPATTPDPAWTPLINNPAYPEYVSGYSAVTGAFTTSLAGALGTSALGLTLTSTAVPGSRMYDSGAVLDGDVINARVWLGIHFRNSDVKGVQLGQEVAGFILSNNFQPTNGR
jgi:hypothetical protein